MLPLKTWPKRGIFGEGRDSWKNLLTSRCIFKRVIFLKVIWIQLLCTSQKRILSYHYLKPWDCIICMTLIYLTGRHCLHMTCMARRTAWRKPHLCWTPLPSPSLAHGMRSVLDGKGIFFVTLQFSKNLHLVAQSALFAKQSWKSQCHISSSCRWDCVSAIRHV